MLHIGIHKLLLECVVFNVSSEMLMSNGNGSEIKLSLLSCTSKVEVAAVLDLYYASREITRGLEWGISQKQKD